MLKYYFFIMFLVGTLVLSGNTSEVDSYTSTPQNLTDSLEKLNDTFNEILLRSIHQQNAHQNSCGREKSRWQLYKILQKNLIGRGGNYFYAKFEKYIERSRDLDSIHHRKRNSIYRSFSFRSSPVLSFARLGTMIKINGLVVGSDKFGHFLATGNNYYKRAYLYGHGLEYALRIGLKEEKGIFGSKTTGVFSYADLSANYNGMLFWKNLFSSNLAGIGPRIVFEDGNWVLKKLMNWKEFIDPTWDERYNCNDYVNSRLERIAHKAIKRVSGKQISSKKCSHTLMEDELYILKSKYPEVIIQKHILNPGLKETL